MQPLIVPTGAAIAEVNIMFEQIRLRGPMVNRVITWPKGLELAHNHGGFNSEIYIRTNKTDHNRMPIYQFSTREPAKLLSYNGTCVQDTLPEKWTLLSYPMYVYGLSDPRSREIIRYVGVTGEPHKRWRMHSSSDNGSPVSRWCKSLKMAGFKPFLKVLEIAFDPRVRVTEMKWIHKLHETLLNCTDMPEPVLDDKILFI